MTVTDNTRIVMMMIRNDVCVCVCVCVAVVFFFPRDFFLLKKLDAPARFFPPEKIEMFFFIFITTSNSNKTYNGTRATEPNPR